MEEDAIRAPRPVGWSEESWGGWQGSALALPGVGAFIAAGPLVSALGGAVAGGVVGGLAGGSGAVISDYPRT